MWIFGRRQSWTGYIFLSNQHVTNWIKRQTHTFEFRNNSHSFIFTKLDRFSGEKSLRLRHFFQKAIVKIGRSHHSFSLQRQFFDSNKMTISTINAKGIFAFAKLNTARLLVSCMRLYAAQVYFSDFDASLVPIRWQPFERIQCSVQIVNISCRHLLPVDLSHRIRYFGCWNEINAIVIQLVVM